MHCFLLMACLLTGGPVQQHNDEGLAQRRIQMKPLTAPAQYAWKKTHFKSVCTL